MPNEAIPGTQELIQTIRQLWPEDVEQLLTGSAADAAVYLEAKVGIHVPLHMPASFEYWLPALREIVLMRKYGIKKT